ncbi:MAG: hypothetical protein OEY52_06630 [Gammaproteobacteria bacterium]|nr:hypothetical protein [Gammaproteobacteria bacterium]
MKISSTLQATMQRLENQADLAKKAASELELNNDEEKNRPKRFGKVEDSAIGNFIDTEA